MTPEQFNVFLQHNEKSTGAAIEKYVNGKLDLITFTMQEHNIRDDANMARILPVIEAYEFSERRLEDAKASGRIVLWVAGFITALGGAVLVVRNIFHV